MYRHGSACRPKLNVSSQSAPADGADNFHFITGGQTMGSKTTAGYDLAVDLQGKPLLIQSQHINELCSRELVLYLAGFPIYLNFH